MKLSELEIKLKISSQEQFSKALKRCIELFGQPTSEMSQRDEYFDTVDRQLKQQDLAMRIRTVNGRKIIAMKSPRMKLPSGITDRIELEFLSDEQENVSETLIKQGLKPIETIEKKRISFVHQDFEILLDQLPFIGYFIEIEGKDEPSIQKMVALLNLEACPVISKHYSELMADKLNELKLASDGFCATFDEEARLSSR